MNGVAQMIENSNPYLNKKGKKLVFENFMYNSMLNELSRLAEDVSRDEQDRWLRHAMETNPTRSGRVRAGMRHVRDVDIPNAIDWGKEKYNQGRDAMEDMYYKGKAGFMNAMDDTKKAMDKAWNSTKAKAGELGDAAWKGANKGFDFALDNPSQAAAIAAAVAITGWGAKKAYDFVKKNGPEAVEALKDKVKPSMMGKVKARFKKLMAKMAFAESVGVNPLKVLKK